MHSIKAYRTPLAFFAVILLAGCSIAGFFYNRADGYILDKADEFLDLDNSQKRQLAASLGDTLEMHRRDELPLYAAYLDYINEELNRGLNPQNARAILDNLDILYSRLVAQLVTALAPTMTTLTAGQVTHLIEQQKEYNEEQAEEFAGKNPEDRLKRRIERHQKDYKFWLGSLTKEQKQLIAQNASAYPDIELLWRDWRIGRQKALIDMLSDSPTPRALAGYLYSWWGEGAGKPEALIAAEKQAVQSIIALTVAIVADMTPKQKNHLHDKLNGYARNLEKLLAESDKQKIAFYKAAFQTNDIYLSASASCLSEMPDKTSSNC